MKNLNDLVADIISQAELINNFYEVEVSVLIRRDGGSKSEFIRAQSHWTSNSDIDEQSQFNAPSAPKWL